MGNTESEVNDSLKAQAGGAGSPECYKLIAVGPGGEMVKLMKTAMQTKDYTDVDNMIKAEIPKYLYNNGAGEMLPIKEFVLKRAGSKPLPAQLGSLSPPSDKPQLKFHCWQLEKSGAVGESLLHVCMLNGTKLHIELAKRLLKYFPKLINDMYLSEDYYGETVLHMAVVSEDPALLKYFLSCGADVHSRASGKFFTPDDQKSGRVNTAEQEEALVPVETNYVGLSYFGEYPLSFAAILNQTECIRLLIAYNADPNKQDTNGNTVMHMMVIKNNLKMFEFMLQFDVRLDIKNKQGLTPLSLAAKLARKEMFDFILEYLRKVEWHYANISCAAYPLDTIDTIGPDGNIDIKSSIYSICYGDSVEHLELLEGYITNLIHVKWETYIKQKFYIEVAIYLVYFFLCGIVLILKRVYFDYLESIGCVISEANYKKLRPECGCAYMNPNDPIAKIRFFLELLSWIYTLGYVFLISNELYVQGYRLYAQTLLLNPFKIFFIFSLFCTLLIIPMHYSCNHEIEDYLMVLAIIMKSLYILYLGRGFTRICTFVYIIHQVIKTQFFRFICIWAIFAFGFSQAFYMSYDYGSAPVEEVFNSPLISLLDVLVMLVNDLQAVYNNMVISKYSIVGRILLFAYMILGGLMMINLLIAMMSNTYDVTHELEREPLRQWARQVLIIEQNIGLKERLKQQKKYASNLLSGEKIFMVRWKQTPEERKELKEKMKVFLRLHLQHMEEDLKMLKI